MRIENVSLPDIYTDSADFRFFCKWFATALEKIQYDTENLLDLYDPLRCPSHLLWMLGDTVGYKYDRRLPVSFNRAVILYFMSMIRNKGSKDGVTLAAEVNLKQFDIETVAGKGYQNADGDKVPPNDILYERLEDTTIPVNAVSVMPHVAEGYIDVVYFSEEQPIDACIEYVRPLGMYLFQTAGVRFDTRTKISIDARLTNTNNLGMSIGPTHVGHYRREDYARMQMISDSDLLSSESETSDHTGTKPDLNHRRDPVWYRNSKQEDGEGRYGSGRSTSIDLGYRALYSLQLSNNDHIVQSLLSDKIFSIGYGPHDVGVTYPSDYLTYRYEDRYTGDVTMHVKDKPWNLRYNRDVEETISDEVYTLDPNRAQSIIRPQPAVNPIMAQVGDAMSLSPDNHIYTKVNDEGHVETVDVSQEDTTDTQD